MRYERIIAEFYGRAWALPEELLLKMHELLRTQAAGVKWDAEEIHHRIEDANARSGYLAREHFGFRYQTANSLATSDRRSGRNSGGKVAVIPIIGVISHRMNMISEISGPGGTSIQRLTSQFREALQAEDCKHIIFDVDSPGGSVDGVPELASEIYAARRQKPITAVCNSMAASAAYWLASAAGELVITPSGQCGSIGVYICHEDDSEALKKAGIKLTLIKAGKYKTEGNPTEPLSSEAYGAFLEKVNDFYGMFVKSVAQNRGTTQTAVRNGYGQGRTVLAADAVTQGLADRVGTFDDILREALGRRQLESAAAMSRGARILGSASKPDDEDDDQGQCKCECAACKGCENKTGDARADDMSCHCGCDACKACTYKSGAAARSRRELELEVMKMQMPGYGRTSDAGPSTPRRDQAELDLLRMKFLP